LWNIYVPGALTSIEEVADFKPDSAITITRAQARVLTAPTGCTQNAVLQITDGTTAQDLTITAASSGTGAVSVSYPAGDLIHISLVTPARGCTTVPANANVAVQYMIP
jgi:hypothetical protein